MAAAMAVVMLGIVIGVLGLVEQDLYVIGLVIVFIGGVGVLVRLSEWLRWLRD